MSEKSYVWTNSKQYTIIQKFYRSEIKRFLLCGLGLLVSIAYLVFYAQLPLYCFFLPVVVFLAALIAMFIRTRKFRYMFGHLGDFQKERLLEEFQNPHEVLKLFNGELHLLPGYLVGRSGGRLFLIPTETIEKAHKISSVKYSATLSRWILYTDTHHKYVVEFIGKQQKGIGLFLDWLRQENNRIIIEK